MNSLTKIQHRLKVPKKRYNEFGKFYYRSVEDIMEALKPLLKRYKCSMYISDEIVSVNDRVYVKATCVFKNRFGITRSVSTGYAREQLISKSMDETQLTGSASSYARKYALGGLFLVDDDNSNDPDMSHDKGISAQDWVNSLEVAKNNNELASLFSKAQAALKTEDKKYMARLVRLKDSLKKELGGRNGNN